MNKMFLIAAILAFALLPGQVSAQGCMEATSDEGVSVVGYIQSQFEYAFGEDEDQYSFTFERARVGLVGNVPYDVSYYIMLEFSPFKEGAPYLLDGFVTYSRLAPYASFSMGQFKAPFSLELNTPCQSLHTIKRSLVVRELASPDRDLGVLVTGSHEKLLSYRLAVMNGTGRGVVDNNKGKGIAGRVVVTPVEQVSLGGSYRHWTTPSDVPDADEDERTRFGGELEVRYGDALLQAEYITGEDKGSYQTGGSCGDPVVIHQGSLDRGGFFVQGMYMTRWNLQPVLKYESYDPNTDEDGDKEQITTFGFNYFLNDWTRVQVNYLYAAEEENEVSNDEMLVQFQVKF
jgi:phosphate-selective porin